MISKWLRESGSIIIDIVPGESSGDETIICSTSVDVGGSGHSGVARLESVVREVVVERA